MGEDGAAWRKPGVQGAAPNPFVTQSLSLVLVGWGSSYK